MNFLSDYDYRHSDSDSTATAMLTFSKSLKVGTQ